MKELIDFLTSTLDKYKNIDIDRIELRVSKEDVSLIVKSLNEFGEIKTLNDEHEKLKQEHAEEITKIMQEASHDKGVKELLHDELQITKCEFKGYRQAVKDILVGE